METVHRIHHRHIAGFLIGVHIHGVILHRLGGIAHIQQVSLADPLHRFHGAARRLVGGCQLLRVGQSGIHRLGAVGLSDYRLDAFFVLETQGVQAVFDGLQGTQHFFVLFGQRIAVVQIELQLVGVDVYKGVFGITVPKLLHLTANTVDGLIDGGLQGRDGGVFKGIAIGEIFAGTGIGFHHKGAVKGTGLGVQTQWHAGNSRLQIVFATEDLQIHHVIFNLCVVAHSQAVIKYQIRIKGVTYIQRFKMDSKRHKVVIALQIETFFCGITATVCKSRANVQELG